MVGTIVSIVYGERKDKALRALVWHALGLLTGGITLGAGLGILHWVLPIGEVTSAWATLGVPGLIALAYGLRESGLVMLPYPQVRRQVPQLWRRVMKPEAFSFFYGVLLGLAFTTHVWVATIFPVVAYSLLRGLHLDVLLLGGALGAGRALPLLVLRWRSRAAGWTASTDALDYVDKADSLVHPLNGILLGVGGAFLMAVLLAS